MVMSVKQLINSKSKLSSKGRVDCIDRIVSKKVKMRRIMLGLTQETLGEATGVTIQQIQKYEKGTNRMSASKLYNLSQCLQVPISYFFEDNDDMSLLNNIQEEQESFGKEDHPSEREIISVIKAFSEIKDLKKRKKIVDLIKSIAW